MRLKVLVFLMIVSCGRYVDIDCYTPHGLAISNVDVPHLTCDVLEPYIDCFASELPMHTKDADYACVALALAFGILQFHDHLIDCFGKQECGGLYYGGLMQVYYFEPIEHTAMYHELTHHAMYMCISLYDPRHEHPIWQVLGERGMCGIDKTLWEEKINGENKMGRYY